MASYSAFVADFLLSALGGSMVSGTLGSHVHDALAAHGAAVPLARPWAPASRQEIS